MARIKIFECDICHNEVRYEHNEPVDFTLKLESRNRAHEYPNIPIDYGCGYPDQPYEVCRECAETIEDVLTETVRKLREPMEVFRKLQD